MIQIVLTRAFGECMKLEIGLLFFSLTLWQPVMAQTPDIVAMPNPDDFLVETYSMPANPVSVQAIPAMPGPTSIPGNMDIITEIFGSGAITLNANQPVQPVQTRNFTPTPGLYYPKQAILTKLPDLPPPQLTVERYLDTTRTPVIQQPDYVDQMLEASEHGKPLYFSVPREVRLKFYPDQSNLSAQAVKWVKAFALKVRSDPSLVIEIRASEENWPLQSKRVGLMLQIILEQGVSRHQIVVYKSARSVDSVLLGYGQAVDQEAKVNKKRQKTISW